MRNAIRNATVIVLTAVMTAPALRAQQSEEGPELLVMISIDQLRPDMLDQFAPAFTGGLKRLMEEGFSYTSASHAHSKTHTAAGHATLSTGVFPARHGIVANEWRQRSGEVWTPLYAVADIASPITGIEAMEGRSPKNLLRSGLADWVMAQDSDARVVSLSGKDRAAITMAGKAKAEVYWLAVERLGFVTSEYYRKDYPRWIRRFNEEVMPELVADTLWEHSAPEEHRHLARADSAVYEGDGVHTTMPHTPRSEDPWVKAAWTLEMPVADRAVALLAQEAIRELELGQRGAVDLLALSFSATDHVGHAYGPLSQEQFDNLVRLDRELDGLFRVLDDEVGEGRWLVGFSADHGVQTMPEHLAAEGIDAVRLVTSEFTRALGGLVGEAMRGRPATPEAIAERLAGFVREMEWVDEAYTHADLTVGEPADSFAILYRNSYYPGRGGDLLSRFGVEIRRKPQYLLYTRRGTTHGTPYWYDRHVPMILMGTGVESGSSDRAVYSVDFAPTLARMGGIRVPDDLDGRVIYPG